MRVAKIRTAFFVSRPIPLAQTQHICFLNPMLPDEFELFDPKITIKTPSWQCKFSDPTVRYLTLGDEPYKMLPERLIKIKREYVFISQFNENRTSNIEYVLTDRRIQSIWGVGMQQKPIHVFDIDIKNDLQVDFSFGVSFQNIHNHIGSAIQSFDLISAYESTTHIGEIKRVQSFTLREFEEMADFFDERIQVLSG